MLAGVRVVFRAFFTFAFLVTFGLTPSAPLQAEDLNAIVDSYLQAIERQDLETLCEIDTAEVGALADECSGDCRPIRGFSTGTNPGPGSYTSSSFPCNGGAAKQRAIMTFLSTLGISAGDLCRGSCKEGSCLPQNLRLKPGYGHDLTLVPEGNGQCHYHLEVTGRQGSPVARADNCGCLTEAAEL